MLLVADALTVERGGRLVLQNLSFALGAGEVLLVAGRNGAGKSTLLRTLAGLLPAQGGRVKVSGVGEDQRPAERMHYLGYEDALKPSLSVWENLAFWAEMLDDPDATDTRIAKSAPTVASSAHGAGRASPGVSPREALAAFGIARLLDLPAAYLSAGQKRRVALARLLLNPRPIWLLDEPLIALDLSAQKTLALRMASHVASGGAIVAASHAPLGLPSRTLDLGGAK